MGVDGGGLRDESLTVMLRPLRRVVAGVALSVSAVVLGPARAPSSAAVTNKAPSAAARIDRRAVVTRHNPVVRRLDPESPLSVGNGRFAFTADVTGLQTFPDAYDQTIPLATLSDWGWHAAPNPDRWSIDTFQFKAFDSHGRKVGYADIPGDQRTPEINWLRGNPHRLHLGQVGFVFSRRDGRPAAVSDLTDIEQTLDMWTGVLASRFTLDGQPVRVLTICHPTLDLVAVRVTSLLLPTGRMRLRLRFPYGTGQATAADWSRPDAHQTIISRSRANRAEFRRTLDATVYHAAASWAPAGTLASAGPHEFVLTPPGAGETLEFTIAFSPEPMPSALPAFDETRAAAETNWAGFWQSGGAIDLAGSTDPRWHELERRIVLSQYLTAIQSAGRYPPQETGLTFNSWEGKFHLEMHWWHAAHFALWGRLPLLEKSLDYYGSILPRAKATAARQGYEGARWPKMTDPSGAESPSSVGPFLIWQQPHPIFYAELCYREHPSRATLDRFRTIVFETAAFMASFPAWDRATSRDVLGPPLQCAQEVFPKDSTFNCTYELTYWRWGLETAQQWRERLGLPRDAKWDRVLKALATPAVGDGKYLFAESAPDSYRDRRWARDHPAVTAAFGMLPGPGIDRETMRRTLEWISQNWNWPDTWGWDCPMLAMTAARLGNPAQAIDFLLLDTPKNVFRQNGHNHQRPGLTVYLPGNGALLYAVAMMAAGWDGGPDRPAPGFPADGRWSVRWEGLRKAP
jgi:hypothetical protein